MCDVSTGAQHQKTSFWIENISVACTEERDFTDYGGINRFRTCFWFILSIRRKCSAYQQKSGLETADKQQNEEKRNDKLETATIRSSETVPQCTDKETQFSLVNLEAVRFKWRYVTARVACCMTIGVTEEMRAEDKIS